MITNEQRRELYHRAKSNALDKGFYENFDWDKFRVHASYEVGEAFEALRFDRFAKKEEWKRFREERKANFPNTHDEEVLSEVEQDMYEELIKDSYEDEFADAYTIVIPLVEEGLLDSASFPIYEATESALCVPAWFPELSFAENTRYKNLRILKDLCINKNFETAAYGIEKFCEHEKIDLYWHVVQKNRYNKTRPKLNGKGY